MAIREIPQLVPCAVIIPISFPFPLIVYLTNRKNETLPIPIFYLIKYNLLIKKLFQNESLDAH